MTDAGLSRSLCAVLVAALSLRAPLGAGSSRVAAPDPADDGQVFGLTSLHQIHVSISTPEWAVLQTSSPRNGGGLGGTDHWNADGRLIHVGSGFAGYFPWVHADLRADDLVFNDVGIRYKGNLSFSVTSAAAPLFANFKLKLDAHGAKGAWGGEKTFNLHAGVVDRSRMREAIAFALFRAADVPASRTSYADVFFTVPGIYQDTRAGLFTVIEDVNKTFLARRLPPGTGLLMKPEGLHGGMQSLGDNWDAYVSKLRPDREATPHEQQRVMEFGRLISQPDVERFRSRIGTYLDVDEFLRFIAVHALIANTDSYLSMGHNFYLYLDPSDDRFRFIPWDEDLSMGSVSFRGVGAPTGPDLLHPFNGDQPLLYWLLDDPAVASRYRAIVRDLSRTAFSKAALMKLVDSLQDVSRDRGPSPRSFLESRADYVERATAGWEK